jgi:hypothetical protein
MSAIRALGYTEDKSYEWIRRHMTHERHWPAFHVAVAKRLCSVSGLTPRFDDLRRKVCARRPNVAFEAKRHARLRREVSPDFAHPGYACGSSLDLIAEALLKQDAIDIHHRGGSVRC